MDFDASWLQPARLLLFLQLNCSTGRSGACDDKMPARLTVDGSVVEGLKAYESRCTVRPAHCTVCNDAQWARLQLHGPSRQSRGPADMLTD